MEKLKRGDKIYLDIEKEKESAVNSYLSCRDGFEGYISGYVEKPKTFSTFIFTSALHVKP